MLRICEDCKKRVFKLYPYIDKFGITNFYCWDCYKKRYNPSRDNKKIHDSKYLFAPKINEKGEIIES